MKFVTRHSVEEVMQVGAARLVAKKYEISTGPGILSGSKKDKPDLLVTLILLLCAVIPGLLYLFLGGRRHSVSLLATAQPDGTTLVTTSAEWGTGFWRPVRRQLAR